MPLSPRPQQLLPQPQLPLMVLPLPEPPVRESLQLLPLPVVAQRSTPR